MKLLINGSNLRGGGGVQAAISFILETRKFPENQYCILASEKLYNEIKDERFDNNYSIHRISILDINPVRKFSVLRTIKVIAKEFNPNCVFTPFGPSYWTPRVPHLVGFALGHLIYPESPYFSTISLKEKMYWKVISKLKKFFLKRNSCFFHVETEDARIRLSKFLKCKAENIYVVSNTYNPFFNYYSDSKRNLLLSEKEKNEFRLVMVSAYYSHKNFEIINKVIQELTNRNVLNIRFVVTLEKKVYDEKFKDNYKYIHNVGPVAAKDCPQLYSECDVLFLPTLIECFSANYPEAMKMKKPILTSDLPFAHDICGDAAIFFDPMNEIDITEKIILLLNNPSISNQLIENGLEKLKFFDNSEKKAIKYLQICEKISIEN